MLNSDIMDRDKAILIFNGKIYSDTNHQYALETALNEIGESLNLDLETSDLNKACDITKKLREGEEIFTLDLFTEDYETYYLICHNIEGYKAHKEIINCYSKENNYILCVFEDYQGGSFSIIQ